MKFPRHFLLPSCCARRMLLLVAILCSALCSCENKRDKNGDLGGMWQMLEWRNVQNQVLKDKRSRIFYSVQLKLIRLRDYNDRGDYYQCYFRHTPDSLVIYRPTLYSAKDSLVSLSDLARFGVPADGKFRIQVLNSDRMVLTSADTLTLVFRKY
ncbi:MAG: lipocalin-like domain-containing protein [Bacteroidaceae bacterium]